MPFNPQSYINPGQFGAWENYAGFKDTDQMASIKDLAGAAEGIAPPTSLGEFAQQAIAPVQKKFENFSNAASQLKQGNIANAYNATQGRTVPIATPAASPTAGHEYDSNW